MPPQTKELTWASADLHDPAERKALMEQEMDKAGERAATAFQRLKDLGIMAEKGDLISQDLPSDMRSGAEREFGGSCTGQSEVRAEFRPRTLASR